MPHQRTVKWQDNFKWPSKYLKHNCKSYLNTKPLKINLESSLIVLVKYKDFKAYSNVLGKTCKLHYYPNFYINNLYKI